MELFKLVGTIAIENDEANARIKETTDNASGAESKMSSTFKKLGGIIATAFAIDKIKDFGASCINAAADASAMSSQFSQVFGDLESTASANLTAIAENTGIVENRLKGSYTQIAAFAKTGGMETAEALSLADRAMVAVADSAAFYDRSLEETTESLQSFLKGNYENDAALGLSCTETTRNAKANELYGKSFNELSEAQKQLTLLQMVEDANALSGAMGQAARESDTWTNQTGNLKQAWTDFQAVIGEKFLPFAVQVVKSLQEMCVWMTENQGVVAALAVAIGVLVGAIGLYNAVQAVRAAMNAAEAASLGALIAMKWADVAASMAVLAPYALVVAAIAAVIAIIVVCVKHWDEIKEAVKNACEKINDAAAKMVDKVVQFVKDLVKFVTADFKQMGENMKQKVEDAKTAVSEKFQAMKSAVEEKVNAAKQTVSTVFSNIQDTISQKVESAKTKVSSVFSSIKSEIESKINSARDAVKTAVDKIKSAFDFTVQFKLKIPKITLSGGVAPYGIGGKGSLPKFNVTWFKKAMQNAMILNEPTIFGYSPASGKLLGGGEAGKEVVSGADTLMDMIGNAVAEQNNGLLIVLEKILAVLLSMDNSMSDDLKKAIREGMDGVKLNVNNREFARLVKAVN